MIPSASIYQVIAYTYEAAEHCEECARARFGTALEWPAIEETRDSEGGHVSECMGSCESDSPHFCEDCHKFLGGSLTSKGEAYVRQEFADNPEVREFFSYLFE